VTARRLRSTKIAFRLLLGAFVSLALAGQARAQLDQGLDMRRQEDPQQQQQIEAKKLSKVPKQTKFVEAEYPPAAIEKNIETDVLLLLDINAKGKVDSVGIAQPPEPPGMGFEEAAMAAAQQFEFEPAEMDGKPIAVQLQYRYKFRLKPKEATPTPADAGPTAPERSTTAAPVKPTREPVVNFSGMLRERGTRLPIAGAVVTVFREEGGKPIGFEAAANDEGKFRFFDLAPGEWKVLVEPAGFYPFRTIETIQPREAIDVTYYVERGSYNPLDVTVTATRPRKEVSRTVLSAGEIDKVPGTAGDPLAVIQNFAGVARAPFGFSGLLIVRGSAPEDSQIFIDGATVPALFHFGGLRSVVPIGILDSIEFYPGNFSSMYGRAMGGVVDVQIKRLQPPKIGGYIDVNIYDGGAYLELPFGKKGGMALAARRSYADVILNAVVPDNASTGFITAPVYYDYQLLANYRPAPAHDIRAMVLGSDDRLALLFRNPADLDTEAATNRLGFSTTFYRGLATYKYIPNPKLENNLRLSIGRDLQDVTAGRLFFHLQIDLMTLRDNLRYKLRDNLTFVAGVDTLLSSADVNIRLPLPPKEGQPPTEFDPNQTVSTNLQGQVFFSPAAFVEAEWRPTPMLLVIPGLRLDYFSRIKQTVPQPRLTVRWQFAQRFTTKGGVGLFVQEPFFDETDPNFGNPALKAERSLHTSAGLEYKPLPYLTLDVTGFYKHLWNLVSPTDQLISDGMGGLRPQLYDNNGLGRIYGAEVIARHDLSRNLVGWLAYTLLRSERRDSGADSYRLFDFDQTHILTIIGRYLLPRNWSVGGRFRLVSGNPTTPIIGGVFNASTDRYDPMYGAVNSSRLPMFHQLDIRFDKRWVYKNWMLNLYLDIQNIYNQQNTEAVTYNYNFTQTGKVSSLPIFTILGIRAEF
jgi:TonB family protein